MKLLLCTASLLTVACSVLEAAVSIHNVPLFPTDGFSIGLRAEFDFDGDSVTDASIIESDGSLCIGNGRSVRCTAGFSVTFAPGFEVFATNTPTQLTAGTEIGPSILGASGTWQVFDQFTLTLAVITQLDIGVSRIEYTVDPIGEEAFIAFRRQQGVSDYTYGFIDLRQPGSPY